MGDLEHQIFEFSDFTLVTKERLLLCDGESVALTAKAFDLLVALVRRAGRLATKQELFDEVWPGTIVEEVNLAVNVSALRKALERSASGRGMIQTVPKSGYRFVGEVATRDPNGSQFRWNGAVSHSDLAVEARTSGDPSSIRLDAPRYRRGVLLAAVLLAAAGATVITLWHLQARDPHTPLTSVAVLPFVPDEPEDAYLADGLAEATINGLAQMDALRVAPRTSTFRLRTLQAQPEEAGSKLSVAAVVTGNVAVRGGKIRIQVDLVDVARRAEVWGTLYEGDMSELINLQNRISQDILHAMNVSPSTEEGARRSKPLTESADAYRAYLEGRYDWNLRTEESLKKGSDAFEHAVAIDPTFAAAYSGLADTYSAMGYSGFVAPVDAFPAASRSAQKAIELDPLLAEPHASLGYVKLYYDWDWGGAEAEFRRAITLAPTYAATHEWLSLYLLAAGRSDEAFQEIRKARELEPLSLPINTDIGFHYYYRADYAEAVKQLKSVLDMKSDFPLAHLWLGRTYQQLGKTDDALTEFSELDKEVHDWPVSIAGRGFVEGVSGRTEAARATLAQLEELAKRKFVTPYGVALVYAGLGEKDEAFARLDQAFKEKSNWLVWLRLDPRWNVLRSDPRFRDLVARMRFPS